MKSLLIGTLLSLPLYGYSQPKASANSYTIKNAPGLRKGELMRITGNDTTVIIDPLRSDDNALEIGTDTFLCSNPSTGASNIFIEFEEMTSPTYDINKYLASHLTYPDTIKAKDIEGRINITFLITKDGTITDVRALKSLHTVLDSNAVEVIRKMPKWNPAKRYGMPVECQFTLPIVYKNE